MRKIETSEVLDDQPKDISIAEFFRGEILAGRLKKGDKLLSDEKIADRYKVNKRTVAAGLNILVRDGLLSRAPRRGTIVIGKKPVNHAFSRPHSADPVRDTSPDNQTMLSVYGGNQLFFIAETKCLTFACFESQPRHQYMWKVLTERFNAKSKARKVELLSLPFDCYLSLGKDSNPFAGAGNTNPDIIQSLLYQAPLGILRDLPEDLAAYASGPETLSSLVTSDFKQHLQKILPIYTAVPVCVWNKEMEQTFGLPSLKTNILDGKLVPALCASETLFPGYLEKIGPHLNNLLRHYGLPTNCKEEIGLEYFKEFFDGLFEGLSLLKCTDCNRMFIADTAYPSYHNFNRKKHFLIATLSCPPHYPDSDYLDFELGVSLFPPKYDLNSELSSLGISKKCKEPEYASDFLRFVASDESQQFMHSCINGIPYRKSSLELLPKSDSLITKQEIALLHRKIKFGYYPWQKYFTIDLISYAMADLFAGILERKITSGKTAAERAFEIFSRSLRETSNFKQQPI